MSAETLKGAATAIRDEWGESGPTGGAWHQERDFHIAVADLLDAVAARAESIGHSVPSSVREDVVRNNTTGYDASLAVAHAYLGTSTPRQSVSSGGC